MRKGWIVLTLLALVGCSDDEINNIVDGYQNGNRSGELKGYWEFEGFYKPDIHLEGEELEAFLNEAYIRLTSDNVIEINDVLLLDEHHIRNLKLDQSGIYYTHRDDQYLWFSTSSTINYLERFQSSGTDNVLEYKWNYQYGDTKDTLKIMNNTNYPVYFVKSEAVDYEFVR